MLLVHVGDLHAAGGADGGVRHVAVAADLVRGVDDDNAAAAVVRKRPRELPDDRRLADARAAEEEDGARVCTVVPLSRMRSTHGHWVLHACMHAVVQVWSPSNT